MARARCIARCPATMAEVRQSAAAVRLHVGPSRQEADLHGRRVRPVARMEARRQPRLACAASIPLHAGLQRWVRELNRFYARARAVQLDFDRTASSGWTATTRTRACCRSCARIARAARWSWSSATSRHRAPSTTGSACRAGRLARKPQQRRPDYGGSGQGNRVWCGE